METVGSFWLENGPNENELECEFLYHVSRELWEDLERKLPPGFRASTVWYIR